jgi:hypothetical protein
MLPRDVYPQDSIHRLIPDYSYEKYLHHLRGSKPYYRYAVTKEEQREWADKEMPISRIILQILAIGGIIFHKRIPVLKNYKSRKARVFFGFIFLGVTLVPSAIFAWSH